MNNFIEKIQEKNIRAIARAISILELQNEKRRELIDQIPMNIQNANVIGVTGPPGVGKSTLINRMINYYRAKGLSVGILAVDPSSPFSGGAILGDRIRMLEFSGDTGVYIRSLASKGTLGGLAPSVYDCIQLLQFAAYDKIIIETVGIGQSEIDIVQTCDTVIVLALPGSGDDVQILKAGILEIANIFVINKSDMKGAETLYLQLKQMLDTAGIKGKWTPPIIKTIATDNSGTQELCIAIDNHMVYLSENRLLKDLRKDQLRHRVLTTLQKEITDRLNNHPSTPIDHCIEQLQSGKWNLTQGISFLKSKLDT